MALIALCRNDALRVNPPQGDQYLSDGGSDWLWAVFTVFALSFVCTLDIGPLLDRNK